MYSESSLKTIIYDYSVLLGEYQRLLISFNLEGESLPAGRAKEHLLHGASRRVFVLHRALINIFTLFPPNTAKCLPRETLYDVQINLHAFCMNLYGIFENCAWAFVIYHDLEETIGKRNRISMFNRYTKKHLPEPLKTFLNEQHVIDWSKYLKGYRDSLAHRIPLYIPPSNFTSEDSRRYRELKEEQMGLFRQTPERIGDDSLIGRIEEIFTELEQIGTPSPFFLNTLTDGDDTRPLYLHPQLISDSKSIIEFANLFIQEWKSSSPIVAPPS